jgi:heme O synthase-like polyprenyltransferase
VEFDEMMSRTANRVLPSGMDCWNAIVCFVCFVSFCLFCLFRIIFFILVCIECCISSLVPLFICLLVFPILFVLFWFRVRFLFLFVFFYSCFVCFVCILAPIYSHAGRMSRSGALTFALGSGAVGTAILFFFVNTWSALLACSNIILYAIVWIAFSSMSLFIVLLLVH